MMADVNSEKDVLVACLERWVTILCDGAYDTEGDLAHDDVIGLAYVMPPSITRGWGAWPHMCKEWREQGRAPVTPTLDADTVAKVIADGLDDDLLVVLWGDPGCDVETRALEDIELLADLADLAGDEQALRLVEHIENALAAWPWRRAA